MIRNYFKILARNLAKNKAFSLINIIGLSIGMAAAILITLWIQREYSMDKFHEKSDRLYVVYNRDTDGIETWVNNNTQKVLTKTLQSDYPEVEAATIYNGSSNLFTIADKKIKGYGAVVDSVFLNMFSFPVLEGDANTALVNPSDIVLTASFAKTLFGNENPVGKTLTVDSASQFTVTAVLQDLPNNTKFGFKYLIPRSYAKRINPEDDSWGSFSTTSYVLLKEGASQTAFESKIKNLAKDNTKSAGLPITAEPFLHRIDKKYLYNKDVNGQLVAGEINKIRMFTAIAGFILLIACINFMNLSTAKSEKRAKEVGIRKVVGVTKTGLIAQFIFESVFLSFLSFIIALGMVYLAIPYYSQLVGGKLIVPIHEPGFWIFSIAFILFTGLLAGSYPAFFLSSFNPVKVLKGTFKSARSAISARKVLVVIQFTFAITLIISTIIIYNQIRYALDRDAGYDREQLIAVPIEGKIRSNYDLIKNEILNTGAVSSMTKSLSPITQRWSDQWGLEWDGSTKQDEQTVFVKFGTDADFAKTMGLKILEGRDIDVNKFPTDTSAILLNEAAIKAMRIKDPIGKLITHVGYKEANYKIVGIVNDFVFESPFVDKIEPMMICGPRAYYATTIHMKLSDRFETKASLTKIEQVLKKLNPDYEFVYDFTDEDYAYKVASAERTGKLVTLFAGLTILISCLGLFGLAAYMAENRTKEIGIRKVLGASVLQVTSLLSKEFIVLVSIAFLIASPIAWYAMNNWLADYSYRTGISWWVFAITGGLAVLITILTVSWQSIKAAIANPVSSLRDE
ncbi:ABC transporter permease [Sphingobacterium sp.]|uniref:ABC transporter permease n=1 Tax=Sphingobacterium sp. TaxID=341027 RepID=UPI00289A4EF1|nr:ABC transporter permease [Sphingobacterium sp.]